MLDSWIDAAIFMQQAQRARRLQQFDEDGEEQAGGIGIANAGGPKHCDCPKKNECYFAKGSHG